MSEPLLQADAQAEQARLWDKAPAWRNLTVAASVLTIAALALPMVVPQAPPTTPLIGAVHPAAAPKVAALAPAPQIASPALVPSPTLVAPTAPPPTRSASIPHAAPLPANPAGSPAMESQQQACTIQMPDSPRPMSGTVIGFIPHEQSVAIFRNTGLSSGGVVNPSFMDDMRAIVRPDPGTNGGSHNPVVPQGLKVQIGDHVTYQTPYRDPSMRCGFFPSQVTADQAPVAAPAGPMPAPPPVQTASLPPAPPFAAPAITPPAQAGATQANVCLMVMAPAPTGFGDGVVISFEDRATSLARIQLTQSQNNGKIDPAYIDNQRVTVRMRGGQYHVFLVPKTLQVHTGDRVTFQGGYRNVNLPCNYVPNLITADLGPAPANTASSPPPQGQQAVH